MSSKIINILFSVALYSCVHPDPFANETKEPVGNIKDGKKQGEWKTYYLNNQIAKIENYRNDTLDGQFFSYNEKGNLRAKGTYRMGTKIDSFFLYNSNGTINLQEWRDSTGKTQGIFKIFHENGQLNQIGYMKDSQLDDTSKTFFKNGKIKTIEFYRNTKKEGKWLYFDEKGNFLRSELYKNDSLQM